MKYNTSSFGVNLITDMNDTEKIFSIIFLMFFLVTSIILSGIVTFFNILYKDVRKVCGYFTISISFNYFTSSIWFLVNYLFSFFGFSIPYSKGLCVILSIYPNFLVIQSQFNFFCIFLSRFLLLRYPFKYDIFCSKYLSLFFLFLTNLSAIFISSLLLIIKTGSLFICNDLISFNRINISIILFFSVVPVLPSFILYILILRIARKHVNLLEIQTNSIQSISKSSKITFLKLIVLIISWIIYAVLYLRIIRQLYNISLRRSITMMLIIFIQISINMLIIIISNSNIRRRITSKCFCYLKKNKVMSTITVT